jgi:hypothetical protein
MTTSRCAQIREADQAIARANIAAEANKYARPLNKIAVSIGKMEGQLDMLVGLSGQVHELELWKADHNARNNGELKTRHGDGNGKIVIPKWAVYLMIPLGVLVVVLSALAGEKIFPFVKLLF